MRRFIAGVANLALLVVAAMPMQAARAESPEPCRSCFAQVGTTPAGFAVLEEVRSAVAGPGVPRERQSDGERPSPSAADPGPLFEYDYRSTCDVTGGNVGCEGGTLKCRALGEQSVFVAQRQVSPTVGAWQLQQGTVCLTPQQQLPFSPAQLQAFVDSYFQRLPLPLPALKVQPSDRAVVNLPLVASTDPPGQTTFSVTQAPFPTITITASVSWRWSWGDGASSTTTWPGRGYDGVDPKASPEHYIS